MSPTLAERLASSLLTPAAAAAMDAHGSVEAAVLVPLFEREGELHAVFTRRRSDMRRHAGEISFPGGRRDFPSEDLAETALRETEEEIGLGRELVEIVGALPPTPTFVTGYRINPFVGLIADGSRWVPQPTEVEEVLELSLPALLQSFELRRLVRRGVPFKTATYTVDDAFVWGATARILGHLLERIGPLGVMST